LPKRKRVINMAHRGGAGVSPENTIYAFSRAVGEYGADVIEMDVWLSSDGHPVVIHDPRVDRTTNATGKIYKMSLGEIKKCDAAYNFTTDGGMSYPLRGMGITIPTLREVFESLPGVRMNIEIQQVWPPAEEKIYDLIVKHGMQDLVLVAAKSHLVHKRFKAVNEAGIAVSASIKQGMLFRVLSEMGLSRFYHPDVYAFQFPEKSRGLQVITSEFIDAAHYHGIEVHAWIINEIKDMIKLLEIGVDGIITDYPDRLHKLLRGRYVQGCGGGNGRKKQNFAAYPAVIYPE